jgi:hypothetical protein
MPKVPLNNISSGYGVAVTQNANNDTIETAFDNTVSRDGTTPNHMLADFDMNGYRILNLGEPVDGSDAIRLEDLYNYLRSFILEDAYVRVVSSLPVLPNEDFPIGSMVFNLEDNCFYQNVADEWSQLFCLGTAWGDITGTLSDQTDLQSALEAKLNLTGGTVTGNITRSTAGPHTYHADATYTSGQIIVSESDPTGSEPDGTIWLKIEAV